MLNFRCVSPEMLYKVKNMLTLYYFNKLNTQTHS